MRVLVVASICLYSCSRGDAGKEVIAASSETLKTIGGRVAEGVGYVGQFTDTGVGAKVVVCEELHNSRAGQLQQAVMLVRLYEKHGLRDIALERGTLRRARE